MAVDEALLSNFKEGDLPIFRLYRWESSLSLGRFSKLDVSIDLEILKNQNLPFVRRMSGGGILVHGGDISYSLILPRESLKETGVKQSYAYLCKFLINFYERLALRAEFAYDLEVTISKSPICMLANEPYDIIIDGKKIGGNAQRYTKNALFQHGSIPLSFDENIFKNIFLEESTLKNINTLDKMGKDIGERELTLLLVETFTQSFEVELVSDTLTLQELESVDRFVTHKYATKRWNIDAKQDET